MNTCGILEETAENIDRLINSVATVRATADALKAAGMPKLSGILTDVFEEIMRVAASLKSQQTGDAEVKNNVV